ncbi:MAG TPA: FHA domain-containing protein, partial [Pyrinomonadaceae bacterium]|nr:FHA domain-containing protein [Pyrinomonadaceae bacterium]
GRRKAGGSPGGTATAGGTTAPDSEAEQRRRMLQQLQELHDAELDPAKKIDYDRSKRNLLDPATAATAVAALEQEVEQHQQEVEQLAGGGKRREFIVKVSAALRERRYDDAETEAENFAREFPGEQEAQNMLARIKTQRLIREARDALDEGGCDNCERAAELLESALELAPRHQGAKLLLEEAEECLRGCKLKRGTLVVAGLLVFVVFVGSILGWYFMSRPNSWLAGKVKGAPKWVLVGVGGAGQGQTFALDKPEIVIGSQGRPAGPADIEICDAQRKISRRHCSIMQNGKQFYVIDESTNGTKVNDRELTRGVLTEIRQGDRLSLADEAVLMLKQI